MTHKIHFIVIVSFLLVLIGGLGWFVANWSDEFQEILKVSDENSQATFVDWKSLGTASGGVVKMSSAFVENPATGDLQSVRIYEPTEDAVYPIVVLIPGGVGSGESFERSNLSPAGEELSDAVALALEGFVVVVYDPLGTGTSEGSVNYQGYDDQDGLAAIVSAAQGLSETDKTRTGLASFSYGVTAAAGVIARHPELGIRFWSDWEGPSSRFFVTVGCDPNRDALKGDISPGDFSCKDDAHWQEREASEFMKTLSINFYWRIQGVKDHVQSTYGHTIEMLQAASENPNIGWFKVNDGKENTVYKQNTLPTIHSRSFFSAIVVPHILEMSQR
jgi:pimeloyl-ACP methyl ester carboxylesterase